MLSVTTSVFVPAIKLPRPSGQSSRMVAHWRELKSVSQPCCAAPISSTPLSVMLVNASSYENSPWKKALAYIPCGERRVVANGR